MPYDKHSFHICKGDDDEEKLIRKISPSEHLIMKIATSTASRTHAAALARSEYEMCICEIIFAIL